jgi:hypothetical protein
MLSRLAAAALGRAAASSGRGCLLPAQQQQCAPHRRRGVEHVGEWFAAARRYQVRESMGTLEKTNRAGRWPFSGQADAFSDGCAGEALEGCP